MLRASADFNFRAWVSCVLVRPLRGHVVTLAGTHEVRPSAAHIFVSASREQLKASSSDASTMLHGLHAVSPGAVQRCRSAHTRTVWSAVSILRFLVIWGDLSLQASLQPHDACSCAPAA